MLRQPLNMIREIRQQVRWYRQWSVLGNCLKRYRRISDKKPRHVMFRELLRCAVRYRCIPDQYFRYDLYRTGMAGERVLDYVPDYVMAMKWFPVVNNHFKQHQLLLNNKIFFKQYLRQYGLPAAPAYLYVLNGTFYTPDMDMLSVDDALDRLNGCMSRRLFCKSDITEGARGITCFDRTDAGGPFYAGETVLDEAFLMDIASRGGFLFEEGIEQHPVLAGLHSGSLNTFRIVTQFHPGAGASVLYAILRMGTGTSCVDNICRGGLFVLIDDERGEVKLPAYDRYHDTYDVHPTSGVPFADLALPFYRDAAKLACRAAEKFPTLASIGWDIGSTPDGPVIIEGNDRWGAAPYQLAVGGIGPLLRHEWFSDGPVPR